MVFEREFGEDTVFSVDDFLELGGRRHIPDIAGLGTAVIEIKAGMVAVNILNGLQTLVRVVDLLQ